jgi:hypothetical protein
MSNAQPLWLRGQKDSYCMVQRWTEEHDRQFAVLPFYEDNVAQPGRECYMLWGRALSDWGYYPIPHDWYSMHLVRANYNIGCYQWVCRSNVGRTRMELNEQEALIDPDSGIARLVVDTEHDIVTPEPVQASLATVDRPATLFYPDVDLWTSLRRSDDPCDGLHLEPRRLQHLPWEGGCFGPVEVISQGEQGLGIQGVSTRLWNRSSGRRGSHSDSDA